ncbi:MAG: DUF721 domain-containing protein [Flavobacteriales bacterium]|jgi:hypothetical protein
MANPDDFRRSSENEPIGAIMDKLLKIYRIEGKLKEVDIVTSWKTLMGGAVAQRTTSIYIKNRILIVHIDSSVMREELASGKALIIQRINERFETPAIDDLWFK